MACVLVTGGSGLIGGEVVRLLVDSQHEVHTLGRRAVDVPGVTHHRVDLLARSDTLPVTGASHLVHCAWYAEPGRFWSAAANSDWLAASLILARTFAASGGRRLVVAGSCAEYGWDRPIFHEDRLGPPPQTLYGQSKRSLFEVLMAAAPVLNLSVGWGRIFIPYGAREDSRRLLGTLLAARAAGTVADFSSGEQVRDFVHVSDVAGALVALLHSRFEGAVNIGTGVGTSVRHFVERAAAIAGYEANIRFGALPSRVGEPASLVADIGRLRREVGFAPTYDIATGLAEVLRS